MKLATRKIKNKKKKRKRKEEHKVFEISVGTMNNKGRKGKEDRGIMSIQQHKTKTTRIG